MGIRRVVRAGTVWAAIRMSSKPTTESWSGTVATEAVRGVQDTDGDKVRRRGDGGRGLRQREQGPGASSPPASVFGTRWR